MKGLLCYASSTGNTRLLAQYASRKLTAMPFDLWDIAAQPTLPDVNAYDVIGFASWTYYLGLPPHFLAFLNRLPGMAGRAIFLLSSFGMMPGWSLRTMEQALKAKGCQILGGASLHMPESYPPFIIKGMDSTQAPEPKEQEAFNAFLSKLNQQLSALSKGQSPKRERAPFDWFNYLIRPSSLKKIRKDMGRLSVDAALCGGCQNCLSVCPNQAIRFENQPVFDETQCQGCWACFNHCPSQAIYTEHLRGKGQYRQSSPALVGRLSQ